MLKDGKTKDLAVILTEIGSGRCMNYQSHTIFITKINILIHFQVPAGEPPGRALPPETSSTSTTNSPGSEKFGLFVVFIFLDAPTAADSHRTQAHTVPPFHTYGGPVDIPPRPVERTCSFVVTTHFVCYGFDERHFILQGIWRPSHSPFLTDRRGVGRFRDVRNGCCWGIVGRGGWHRNGWKT
jgi:hypothetical protein